MSPILIIFGTRPEILKFVPLIEELKKSRQFSVNTVFTGQHDSLARELLKEFSLDPDVNLSVLQGNQSLGQLSGQLFAQLEPLLTNFKPKLIIAQGDTTTALVAAQLSFYHKIPFAHLEAGLRTNNMHSPFPEEFNRKVISLISCMHFCPTLTAKNNLIQENINTNVYITGNTIIDLIHKKRRSINKVLNPNRKIVLVTCHRRENFGEPLKNICSALKTLAQKNKELYFIFPVHPNPNVFNYVQNTLGGISNIELTSPLHYSKLIEVLSNSYLVLTDSGGLQEEAPALDKPVLILRNTTERPEGIATGAAKLIGTSKDNIVAEVNKLLKNQNLYKKMSRALCPYGDGQAAKRITKIILSKMITTYDVSN